VAGAKPIDARNLTTAFVMYASDHQGRFPSSLDQVAKYLAQYPLSGTNKFDIIYHGSLDELKGIPRGSVAVVRERQTWIAPSGKRARVYGMADGHSEIIESDDDFKAWEAEHIISPPPGNKPSRPSVQYRPRKCAPSKWVFAFPFRSGRWRLLLGE